MAEQLSGGDSHPSATTGGGPGSSASNPQTAPTIYSLAGETPNSSAASPRGPADSRPQMIRTAVQVAPMLSIRRPAQAVQPATRPAIPARPSYRAEGAICLLVAIGWGFAAQYCYREVGTLMLLNALSGVARLQEVRPAPAGPGGVPAGRAMEQSFSLFPPDSARGVAGRGAAGRSVSPRDSDMQSQQMAGADEMRRQQATRRKELEAEKLGRMMEYGEGTRIVWALATFFIAGLIGIVAMACIFRTTAGRLAPYALLCIALGVGVGGLVFGRYLRPPGPEDSWRSWLITITQSRYSWVGHVTVAVLPAVVAGLFALRPTSDPRRWLVGAIGFMFVGTFLTLAGISALETYGGFPPLPAWHYAVVAAGQSFFAWVLMVMLHWRHPLGSR